MKKILILCFIVLPFVTNAQSHYPGQHTDKFAITDRFKPAVYSFDLADVKLLDSRFRDNMLREQKWLLQINLKSLLHSFCVNAGMFDAREGGYDEIKKLGGWESLDSDLRGHSTGHILSGLSLMFASTGEAVYKLKGDTIINTLYNVQKVLNQDGYLSAFPQEFVNRAIRGESVWAPWYTLHKILAGVLDQYLYCDNHQALAIARNFSQWAYNKLIALTPEQRNIMLRNEFGGINETFYNLYAITGNNHDLWLADFFYDNRMLDPLKKGNDNLKGTHANTYIPKLLGITRSYEIENKGQQNTITQFFWQTVVNHHSFATGSNSDKEHFFTPDKISKHLTGYTGESCNVYNMLKLTRHLYIQSGDVRYADYYEKALINHILGQQDPATGMIAYFLPLLPGAHKVYSTPDSSFWCCVGTGFENQAKYGEGIYYHTGDTLLVNLFIPSEIDWKEKNLLLRQQTKFPESSNLKFTINSIPHSNITLSIRYPQWAVNGAHVKINGKTIQIKQQNDSYISITRKWKKGDIVEVAYPMELHTIPANDDSSVVAIAYGPVILAGEMGTDNFKNREPYSDPNLHNDYYTYDYHIPENIPTQIALNPNNIDASIKKMSDMPLTFRLLNDDITLRPLYDIHRERYVTYWDLKK